MNASINLKIRPEEIPLYDGAGPVDSLAISDSKCLCIDEDSSFVQMIIKRGKSNEVKTLATNHGKLKVEHSFTPRAVREQNGSVSMELLTTITLQEENPDPDRVVAFAKCLSGIIPEFPTLDRIDTCVIDLKDIFTETKGTSNIVGLWGELFCMSISKESKKMVEGWKSSQAKHDFSCERERIEVKCSQLSQGQRSHSFSLSSLQQIQGDEIAVVSVLTSSINTGKSCKDLCEALIQKHPELESEITTQVFKKLGLENNLMLIKFDFDGALSNLKVFNSTDVPRPCPGDPPPGVTQVKFTADLTHAKPMSSASNANGVIQSLIDVLM